MTSSKANGIKKSIGRAVNDGDLDWQDLLHIKLHLDEKMRDLRGVRVRIQCPKCRRPHIDQEKWAETPHRWHLCDHCGQQWKPHEYHTIGVQG